MFYLLNESNNDSQNETMNKKSVTDTMETPAKVLYALNTNSENEQMQENAQNM